MSKLPATENITSAAAPFNLDRQGDCILQSSDNVQFKTYRLLLTLASPFFHDMLSFPQPTTIDIPTIRVTEDAPTLRAFLLLIMPSDTPDPWNVDLAINTLTALQKYLVLLAKWEACAKALFTSKDLLDRDGLGLYALAWRLKLKDEAVRTSQYTHYRGLDHNEVLERLLRISGSVSPLVALIRLCAARNAALDGIIAHLRLHRHVCDRHHASDLPDYDAIDGDLFSSEVATLKYRAHQELCAPFPSYQDISDFFDIGPSDSAAYGRDTFGGARKCQCYTSLDFERASGLLSRLVDEFPKEIDPPKFD